MSQKSFTSHGHPIPGALYRRDQQPRNVARCGGPGLCPECSREAGHGNNKNRTDTIDHQQAAVLAGAKALADDWNPDRDPVLTAMFSDYSATALAAATPHLRAAWAAELGATFQSGERWNETYRKGLRTLQYEKAYLDGVIDILALLEGGGE